ncbi:MAG: hypothetical protein GY846_26340 [Deltaproteobacteria bacterium]|nr:hypothetical protein [Deltaproteobacteria bacterium]
MAWEDVKAVLRPQSVHMGSMTVDEDICNGCELCVQTCVTQAWEMGEDDIPRLREDYACLSCYNCMVVCTAEAISIGEPYHVDNGFWETESYPLQAKLPMSPKDEDGNPDSWNPIEEAVFNRRSVRNYLDKPVPEPTIRRVLEAGRFAPSSGNCQPWKFVVVTRKSLVQEMDEAMANAVAGLRQMYLDDNVVSSLEMMVSGNPAPQFDPRMIVGGFGSVARKEMLPSLGAPAVIILAGDTRSIGGPDLQLGICGQNMNLVANSLGIRSCWIGYYQSIEMFPELKEKLGLGQPWKIISGLVLGYPEFNQDGIVAREYRPVTWIKEGSEESEID